MAEDRVDRVIDARHIILKNDEKLAFILSTEGSERSGSFLIRALRRHVNHSISSIVGISSSFDGDIIERAGVLSFGVGIGVRFDS